jgi:hypothetical protein
MSVDREDHADGSHTDRHPSGQSITYNPDGSVRHETHHDTSLPVPRGVGPSDRAVTTDGKENILNDQPRKP